MPSMDQFAEPAGRERPAYRWLLGAMAAYLAGLMVYTQTLAYTGDEGFHFLTDQLIRAGMRPYLDFCYPQASLNNYWNAMWMGVFGESWRAIHAVTAVLAAAAILLMADFLFRRFPVPSWRLAAALAVVVAAGLNQVVVEYGTLGQAYGMCLFATVAAFRCAIAAVDRSRPWMALAAGFFAGDRGGAAGAAGLDLLPQPRRQPLVEGRGGGVGCPHPVRADAVAARQRACAGVVQPGAIPRVLPQAVLAGHHPARPGGGDRLDRLRTGADGGTAGPGRRRVPGEAQPVAARAAVGAVPVRVAEPGSYGGTELRAPHVSALLSAGGAVSGPAGRGGALRRRQPAPGFRPAGLAGPAAGGADRGGPGESDLRPARHAHLARV